MPWIIVFLTLIEICSAKLASIGIYWNASNPIFRIDNTDHIIDVNRGNNPFEYDQVNIICPTYTEETKEPETYIIYNVSKEEYDTCRITNSNPRIIAICDNPAQLKYFTITFRSFTPQPGGLEFKPGRDYYFVTTSTGKREGLDRRIGGRCSTHHMKVIFKVCCSDGTTASSDNNSNTSGNNSNKTSNHHQLSIESSSSSQTISSTSSSSTTHSPLHHVTSSSHLISTLPSASSSSPSSSSSSSSYQSLNKEPLFNDWTSLLGSFSDNSNTLIGGIVSSSLTSTTTSTSVPVPVPVTSIPSLFSTLFPPSASSPSSSSSSSSSRHPIASPTIPAASEHWWKPHFTRFDNLQWRSKSPGNINIIKSTGQHYPGKNDPGSTADSNASSRNTLQPVAWTVFAISCFIFIIFWALWYKVKRNNVMLPMSK